MQHEDVRIRFRYERGRVWQPGHLARFAEGSSRLLQSMPWAVSGLPLGNAAGLANGALDIPGLQPEPEVRLRAIEANGHALIERVYDREGRLARIDYFDGVSARYEWNERGWITSVQAGKDRPARWTYRDDGLATSVTYPDGSRFLFDYTDDQRPLRRVYPDGWTITFHYDTEIRLVEAISPGAVFSYPTTATDGVLWRVIVGEIHHAMPPNAASAGITCSLMGGGSRDKQQIVSALGVWTYEQGQLREMVLPNGERRALQVSSAQSRLYDRCGSSQHYRNSSAQWTSSLMHDGRRMAIHRFADGRRLLNVGPTSVSLLEYNDSGQLMRGQSSVGRYVVVARDRHKRIRRVSTDHGCLYFGYDRAANVSNIETSTGFRATVRSGPSHLPNRIAVSRKQCEAGDTASFLAASLWQITLDMQVDSGIAFGLL